MHTSSNGRKLIEEFEGLILQAYDDYNDKVVHTGDPIRGTLTIGYGHTTSGGEPAVYVGMSISSEQADGILAADLGRVEAQVQSLVKVPLNQNEFDALVSFQFNTGALGHSSALTLLNQNNRKEAADHLMLYNKANGQILQGLIRRRQAEKDLFLKPVTQKDTDTWQSQSLLQVLLQFFQQVVRAFTQGTSTVTK